MKCIAQDTHDENIFWVKLHGGKVRSRFNYRKHIDILKSKSVPVETKKRLDSIGENLLRKQTEIGRQRISNKHKR